MNFKTMTSLVVLAALSCGEKASAVLQGPFGDVINQDSRMVRSFKAPVDTSDQERQKTATARAVAMLDPTNTATVEKGLKTDIKAAFLIHYVHMLQEADFQGRVGGKTSQFKTAVLADRLQQIEAFDISTGDFASNSRSEKIER